MPTTIVSSLTERRSKALGRMRKIKLIALSSILSGFLLLLFTFTAEATLYDPPYSSTHQLRVNISDMYPDAECGVTEFYFAVHADLYNSADGTEEGGWACGNYQSPGSHWSWSFTDTPCTLTQGYWKTHSSYGPAPYDVTWAIIGDYGEEEPFFESGNTWYSALWVSPTGDAYWILAHQYIAAYLNALSGALITTEVEAALLAAHTWFSSYGPRVSPSSDYGQLAVELSGTLDDYNNGIIGPGHCEE